MSCSEGGAKGTVVETGANPHLDLAKPWVFGSDVRVEWKTSRTVDAARDGAYLGEEER